MDEVKKKRVLRKSVLFFVVSLLTMFLYESVKQIIFPAIHIWTSHIFTIIFVSVLSSTLSYFYFLSIELKKLHQKELEKRVQFESELSDLNTNLEKAIAERTEFLIKINEELETAKEKAEEASKAKTMFLQNMSHELRTPLNAIMGFSQLMENEVGDKNKLTEYSKIIYQNGSDLLGLIDEILNTSRIESGRMPLYPEEFYVKGLLDELENFFCEIKERLKIENIELETNFRYPPDAVIFTDRKKLKHIFTNLIYNAFKFTHSGTIGIGCSYLDGNFIFWVSDTGLGINHDKLPHIFDRFVQIENKYSRKYSGSGLGLSIVKNFVELLGGSIFVESQPGRGTTFTFKIPGKIIFNNNLN
jgi:signal transduction histidine kinase